MRIFFSALFVYLIFMYKKVYLICMCVVCRTLPHQKSSAYIFCSSKVMRYEALCFGVLLLLLRLLLSTVLCAYTVMISLVVQITRDFESQLKSSGHATHSQSF